MPAVPNWVPKSISVAERLMSVAWVYPVSRIARVPVVVSMVHGICAKPSLAEVEDGVKLRVIWQLAAGAKVLTGVRPEVGQSLEDSAKV